EGVKTVALCLVPGLRCETPLADDSFLVRRGMTLGDRYLGPLFDIAGMRHFKSRFRPRYENRYVCAWPHVSLGTVLAFVKVLGVFNLDYVKLGRVVVDRLRKHAARKTLADVA